MIFATLIESSSGPKKWKVVLRDGRGSKLKTIRFGARGYSDYTLHRDSVRKASYISRHKSRENWTFSKGVFTAGFWARWVLWNKPSVGLSIQDMERKFRKLKISKR